MLFFTLTVIALKSTIASIDKSRKVDSSGTLGVGVGDIVGLFVEVGDEELDDDDDELDVAVGVGVGVGSTPKVT